MKCECEECYGTGKIECPECDGTGELDLGLDDGSSISERDPRYAEFKRLQQDAARVKSAAARLIQLKPEHAGSYSIQLQRTLAILEALAETLIKQDPEQVLWGQCEEKEAA